ncbi:MAG: GTPase RsgA, partial [Proteobacteria bacterium]|nr:GTPase RsgA [Pseudomonadota bacterium]
MRKVAGTRTQKQVIAVNIDTVFIASGLDADHNPRRVERYLTLAWNSGAMPVILLTKSDVYNPRSEGDRGRFKAQVSCA